MTEFYQKMKGIVPLACCLVERPGDGQQKKEDAKTIIYRSISDKDWDIVNIKILDEIIGNAIDVTVAWLNRDYWKKEKNITD